MIGPGYAPSGSPRFGPVCAPPGSQVFGRGYARPPEFVPVYASRVNSGNELRNPKTGCLTVVQRKEGPSKCRRVDAATQRSKEKDHEKKGKLIQCHKAFLDCLYNYKIKFSNLSQENKNIIDNIDQIISKVDQSFKNCNRSFGSDDFKGKYDAYLKKTDKVLMYVDLISEAKSLELLINESNKLDDVNKETFRSSFKNLFDQFEFIMERIKFDTDPTSIYSNAKEMYKIIKENFEERTNGIPCKN